MDATDKSFSPMQHAAITQAVVLKFSFSFSSSASASSTGLSVDGASPDETDSQ